jgi:hypothetical protein
MKTILAFLLVLPVGLLLSGCGAAQRTESPPSAESVKGYELYSWQEGDQWAFSLLAGTNRTKSLEEIKSGDARLPDVEALIARLEKIPAGQYVTWSSQETLAFPPDEILRQIERVCKDRGLILNVAQ